MKIIALGTGANGGIPEIGCSCRVCLTSEKKPAEMRTRSSIALALDDGGYLILDTTPDVRTQLSREKIYGPQILALFLTHTHYDHVGGLVEFLMTRPYSIGLNTHPLILKWLVEHSKLGKKSVFEKYLILSPRYQNLTFGDVKISGFEVPHTTSVFGPTLGFRIETNEKKLVYIPDLAKLNKGVLEQIQTSDMAILDGTFYDKSLYNHISIKETIRKLKTESKPTQVYFTHVNHTEGLHHELSQKLRFEGEKFGVLRDGAVLYLD